MKLQELYQYWKSLSKEEVEAQMQKFNAGILAFKLNPNITFKEAQEALKLPPFLAKIVEDGLELTNEEKKLLGE